MGGSFTDAVLLVPVGPEKEIQVFTVDADGGTFKIKIAGQTSKDLAFGATKEEVEGAIEGLSTVQCGLPHTGTVTVQRPFALCHDCTQHLQRTSPVLLRRTTTPPATGTRPSPLWLAAAMAELTKAGRSAAMGPSLAESMNRVSAP